MIPLKLDNNFKIMSNIYDTGTPPLNVGKSLVVF